MGKSQGSLKLFISPVPSEQDPYFLSLTESSSPSVKEYGGFCIEGWIVFFAQLFKNHLGFSEDSYMHLHQMGMKLFSEAMGEVVEREDARRIFQLAECKLQEMAALALFNWGNVYMSKGEYKEAGNRFEEAIQLKPNFFLKGLSLALPYNSTRQSSPARAQRLWSGKIRQIRIWRRELSCGWTRRSGG